MSEFEKGNEDKQLKPGDWIVAYRKGYHKLVRIERRYVNEATHGYIMSKPNCKIKLGDEYAALVYYQTISPKTLKISKGEHCCDIAYCMKAGPVIAAQIERLQKIQEMMK